MAVRVILCLVYVKYSVTIDSNIVTVSCKNYFLIYTLFWFIALPLLTLVLAAFCHYLIPLPFLLTQRPQFHGHPARNLGSNVVCCLHGIHLILSFVKMVWWWTSSSIGTTAHCGLCPVEQCPSIFFYLPPTLSIFSLPALEDPFLLPLSIFSCVFLFFSSLPVLEWRSFWASYPPPFSLGDQTSLPFALLSILLYFLLCSSLLVLDSSDFSIPRFHI